ncbi:MAG TPA: hypothetical protein VIL20_24845 [Sandaracinaceae bacterium]
MQAPSLALFAAGLAAALALSSCGSTAPGASRRSADRLAPATLYPMIEGAQWVYDVDTGGAEPPTLGIFEVVSAEGDRRSIANNRGMTRDGRVRHGDPVTYEIAPEGIRHVASGRWVLRAPIREGAEWEAMGGRTARVVNTDLRVEVVAGTYEHCVDVEETGGEDGRVVRTVYCPEVGPVLIESRMESRLTTRSVALRARLRSYDSGAGDEL